MPDLSPTLVTLGRCLVAVDILLPLNRPQCDRHEEARRRDVAGVAGRPHLDRLPDVLAADDPRGTAVVGYPLPVVSVILGLTFLEEVLTLHAAVGTAALPVSRQNP